MDMVAYIREVLSRPPAVVSYSVSQDLAKFYPEKALLQSAGGQFDVEAYARAGHAQVTRKAAPYPEVVTHWWGREFDFQPGPMPSDMEGTAPGEDNDDNGTQDYLKNAWLDVEWEGARLEVLLLVVGEHGQPHLWILADDEATARRFLVEVSRWTMEVRGEVLVFENGMWQKDEQLYRAIRGATFDNLILHRNLKRDIRDDVTQFFGARAMYDEYGIPWKRGILFVGPPGNGKTHTVKALLNALGRPCLYVKSFRAQHGVDELSIRAVFHRARRTAPCVLVLEDLDSLLTPQNRSYFLNELDGFATNGGILTLATTNHPERLDSAILDRPSRFDRKYPFDLPGQPERHAYLTLWNGSVAPALALTEEGLRAVSEQSEGFSFAYLKELCLASTMRWLATAQPGTMDAVMLAHVGILREQMVSVPMPGDEPASDPAMSLMRMVPRPPFMPGGWRPYGRFP